MAGATRAVVDAAFLSGLGTASLAQRRVKGFPARSYAKNEWRRCRGNARALRVEAVISKPPQVEAEVVPVSPEDSIKVDFSFLPPFRFIALGCGVNLSNHVKRIDVSFIYCQVGRRGPVVSVHKLILQIE